MILHKALKEIAILFYTPEPGLPLLKMRLIIDPDR
jgi:hypothetical protein